MEYLSVMPGDVVVTNFGIYQHWSLVTDNICDKGKYMLISATKRNGTVLEEPWDIVTQGNYTYIVSIGTTKPTYQIINDARLQIGKWKYSVTKSNCEHFIKNISGLKMSSSQVNAGFIGAISSIALVSTLSKNPNPIKVLTGALIIGVIALNITNAIEKQPEYYLYK